MKKTRTIRVGSRESHLAVVQAELIMAQIQARHPELELELVTMKTTGDKILDRPLDQIGGKGLFVRELDQALLDGRIDLSVHSLKDLPMQTPEQLPLVAFSRRADPRDVLVLPKGVSTLDPNRPLGCSSKRRTRQLKALFPQMQVQGVRGNLQTRLAKLENEGFAALVLAYAGLARLGLEARISRVFSVEELLPAAGQGILAVQARAGEDVSFLDGVEDLPTRYCALAERAFVRTLDGGCSAPIAAYATCANGSLKLTGFFYEESDGIARRGSLIGRCEDAEALGERLANRLKG
ncbi:MAG: hydroxymethylbilane synthase [Anaerotruncus sp.]|nr:hydroxymethylbilane synthase [Anaerotruncus sp.]